MTWVKVDDEMPWNQKVAGLSPFAFRAYINSICYCGRFTTSGDIKRTELALIPHATLKLARELVAAGVWEARQDGWYVHDFLVYNRSREHIDDVRAKRALAGRLGGQVAKQDAKQSAYQSAEQFAEQFAPPNARSVSLCDPLIPEEREIDLSTGESRERAEKQKSSKLLSNPKRTRPDEDWLAEMRGRYGPLLRDFDETLSFHMNGSYYRGCADKCGYLERKLEAAVERERGRKAPPGGGHDSAENRAMEKRLTELQRQFRSEVGS